MQQKHPTNQSQNKSKNRLGDVDEWDINIQDIDNTLETNEGKNDNQGRQS